MKRIYKKKYPRTRAFFATLGICFLICFLVAGMGLVFVRTESIMSAEPKPVFRVVQNDSVREVTVFGEVYRTELSGEEKGIPPILYALIPPEVRAACGLVELAFREE